jgi:hypothetical protein
LMGPEPTGPLPEVANDPEQHDAGQRKVGREKVLGCAYPLSERRDGDVELQVINNLNNHKVYLIDIPEQGER